jgi:uncharacterized protein YcfJ
MGSEMNKSMLTGVVFGAVAVTAIGAFGGYRMLNPEPEFAEVLAVKPVTKSVAVPQEECREEVVVRQEPVKDEHQITGTAIGAVVGGLIGSQIGGGSGKKVATAAGAVAGGYAGNKTQETMQKNDTYTETQTLCETVQYEKNQLIGYDVEYRLGDETGTIRMNQKPGKTIPVNNGKLVLVNPDKSEQ